MNLKIKIGKYQFDGPFNFLKGVQNTSGVYVVLCGKGSKNQVLGLGESEMMRRAIHTSKEIKCWKNNCKGYPKFAFLVCNKAERVKIAAELRAEFNPPCGD
ncbi:hypothetical protein LCGC14_1908910 [marine sediment metagenome]|uniref:GIY-YIG domain-containing protein n=1 Tax=marine sediment metagenome TaxID=412755 RepID=A0A0F9GHH7_9ZZZZ